MTGGGHQRELPAALRPVAQGLAVLIVAAMVASLTSPPAAAQAPPGDPRLGDGKLSIYLRLGQPGGGGGGGLAPGRVLRYIPEGEIPGCEPLSFEALPPGIEPWLGIGGDPSTDILMATVLSVNRADPSDAVPVGFACLPPDSLVAIPTEGDVLTLLRERRLLTPKVGANPTTKGLTGLESHFWVDGNDAVDIPALQFGPFTIHAAAHVTRYDWSYGDQETGSSADGGSRDRPAVRHTYDRKSGSGTPYEVVVTATWVGTFEWRVAGDFGSDSLGPTTTTSDPLPYPVSEVRSVLQ